MTKLQNPLDNLEQPETLIKQAKPRGIRGIVVRERNFIY